MPRLPAAQIRAKVIAAIDAACASGRTGTGDQPVVRGPNWVRKGRWVITDTLTAGVLVACEVSDDGLGMATYVGAAATIRPIVPLAVRAAWIANQFGEDDTDP